MIRIIGAILVGLVFSSGLEFFILDLAARNVWPDYAAAFPNRSFTLPMLLTRQIIGVLITIAGGFVVSEITRQNWRAVLWAGLIGLAGGMWNHLHEPVWSHYPLWYHLLFFSYLVPGPLLGGWLHRRVIGTQS